MIDFGRQTKLLAITLAATLVTGLVTFGVVAAAPPAFANGGCTDGYSWFDGTILDQSQYSGRMNGDQATIDVRGANVCTGISPLAGSVAWAAIGNLNNGGIIQVGYSKHVKPDGTVQRDWVAEWGSSGSSLNLPDYVGTLPDVGSPTVGQSYAFKVNRLESGSGDVQMKICTGGTCDIVDTTTKDPYADWGWGGNTQAENFGEAHDSGAQTDMPGTSSAHANFNVIQVKVDSSWVSKDFTKCVGFLGCTGSLGGTSYHFEWDNQPSDDHFSIWTG